METNSLTNRFGIFTLYPEYNFGVAHSTVSIQASNGLIESVTKYQYPVNDTTDANTYNPLVSIHMEQYNYSSVE